MEPQLPWKSHIAEDCTYLRICYYCHVRYHTTLCNQYNNANHTTGTTCLNANNSANPTANTRTFSKVVAAPADGSSTLQTNLLSVIPATYAIHYTHQCMRRGIVAVKIRNPSTNETKLIYAFHNTGSQMTILQKSVAEEIRLCVNSYIQPCGGLHVDAEMLMKDPSLQVCGLAESEFHDMANVWITDRVPTLGHSLPNTLILQEHPNFADIDYPLLDRDCCNLLIGSDCVQLLVPHNETEADCVSGYLNATCTHVGWIVSRYEGVMADTYLMSTPVVSDEDSQQDFEELPNNDDIVFSNEDRIEMDILNSTIKRVDDHKFQIAVPL